MSDEGVYERVAEGEKKIPLYATPEEIAAEGQDISSLSELVDKSGSGPRMGGLKNITPEQQAEFDRLAREAQAAYDAEPAPLVKAADPTRANRPLTDEEKEELIAQGVETLTFSSTAGPTAEQREQLLKAAMAQAETAPTVVAGPSQDERIKLLQMAQEQNANFAPKQKVKGPTEEERRKLMEQALKTADVAPTPSTHRIPDEQRQQLLERAMASQGGAALASRSAKSMSKMTPEQQAYFDQLAREAQEAREREAALAQKDAPLPKPESSSKAAPAPAGRSDSVRSNASHVNRPSDEDRRKLMEQALASKNVATGSAGRRMPSAEERAKLASMAMANAQRNPIKRAPTMEERAALAAKAMQVGGDDDEEEEEEED